MKKLSDYSFADLWAMCNYIESWSGAFNPQAQEMISELELEMDSRIKNTDFSPVAESNTLTNTNPSKTT